MSTENTNGQKKLRGFAAMDKEKQRKIASMGGKASHESGHAHEFTSEEAREAGRKGGEKVHENRRKKAEGNVLDPKGGVITKELIETAGESLRGG